MSSSVASSASSAPVAKLPQKRYYRQRAHSNPMSDHCFDYPVSPQKMDWKEHYPDYEKGRTEVRFADIGCGYGGLLVQLSPLFPDKLMLGMEIRVKVSDYVKDRVKALREQNEQTGGYRNIACIRWANCGHVAKREVLQHLLSL